MIPGIDREKVLAALRGAGIEADTPIVADGRIHRFRDWLDKPGTRNCWYILFPDYPLAGAFGCWRRGIKVIWHDKTSGQNIIREKIKGQLNKILDGLHAKGRLLAQNVWEDALPANGRHGYLITKQIRAHGLRYARGALLVPVLDQYGTLHGLQQIYRNGDKRFTRGTDKHGHYYLIGTPGDRTVYIAEGFGTAATVHEVTGSPVAVAFDAGNLLPVATALRSAYPDADLILCADDDKLTAGNPGITKARQAAVAVGATVLVPRFNNPVSRGTDFNDMYREEGADAVRRVLVKQGVPICF